MLNIKILLIITESRLKTMEGEIIGGEGDNSGGAKLIVY